MPYEIAGRITGVAAITRAFNILPEKIAIRHYAKIMRAATKPLLTAAKGNARAIADSGAYSRALIAKVTGGTKRKKVWAAVGADSSHIEYVQRKSKPGVVVKARPSKYSHLVELGTYRSKAKPVLRPALNSTRSTIEDIIAHGIENALNTEIRALPKTKLTI